MARPFWSGQLRISLVSFGIRLFPATEAKGEIHFHQLNRRTGERIRHQNISGEDDVVEDDEIVKGYEYSKGEYVIIEPEEIENLRVPSRQTIEVTQFCSIEELELKFFEKPYFVTPENTSQDEAFAVVRKALQDTQRIALGKIAFGGREHVIGIAATDDKHQLGMMAYTLRYPQELRNPAEYFAEVQAVKIDEDQLTLAKELIQRKTSRFNPKQFSDEYEDALRAMIAAKVKHVPMPKMPSAAKPAKVVNLMDALRKSLHGAEGQAAKKPVKRAGLPQTQGRNKKLSLVNPSRTNGSRSTASAKKRRSA